MEEIVTEPITETTGQETRKSRILILTEQHLAQLNELFDKVIPPAYARPLISLLNTCPAQEVDIPVNA